MNIKQVNFGAAHYINQDTPKKQIYLHHTAGNDNAEGVFKYWEQTTERVATCVAIDSKGLIVQGFPSTKWAYHLGLETKTFNNQGLAYQPLDQLSIGIEICNWGYLTQVGSGNNATYHNYVGMKIPRAEVIKLDTPFKGQQFFHNYTDAQIEAVKELLLLWNDRYKIPLDYNDDIWGICPRALSAKPGVYTHNSVRKDKTDVYPHPGLIEMLKSLTAKEPILVGEPKAKSSGKSKK
jgi:N-acetyl-anhydromuramyl-L-alanine amidase AmpD